MVDYLRSLLFIKSGITKEALLGQAPSEMRTFFDLAKNDIGYVVIVGTPA